MGGSAGELALRGSASIEAETWRSVLKLKIAKLSDEANVIHTQSGTSRKNPVRESFEPVHKSATAAHHAHIITV